MGGKSKRHRKQQKSKARSLESAAVSSDSFVFQLLYNFFITLLFGSLAERSPNIYNACFFFGIID